MASQPPADDNNMSGENGQLITRNAAGLEVAAPTNFASDVSVTPNMFGPVAAEPFRGSVTEIDTPLQRPSREPRGSRTQQAALRNDPVRNAVTSLANTVRNGNAGVTGLIESQMSGLRVYLDGREGPLKEHLDGQFGALDNHLGRLDDRSERLMDSAVETQMSVNEQTGKIESIQAGQQNLERSLVSVGHNVDGLTAVSQSVQQQARDSLQASEATRQSMMGVQEAFTGMQKMMTDMMQMMGQMQLTINSQQAEMTSQRAEIAMLSKNIAQQQRTSPAIVQGSRQSVLNRVTALEQSENGATSQPRAPVVTASVNGPAFGASAVAAPIVTRPTVPVASVTPPTAEAASVATSSNEPKIVLRETNVAMPAPGVNMPYTLEGDLPPNGAKWKQKVVTFSTDGKLISNCHQQLRAAPANVDELVKAGVVSVYQASSGLGKDRKDPEIKVKSGNDLLPFKELWPNNFREAHLKALNQGVEPQAVDLVGEKNGKSYTIKTVYATSAGALLSGAHEVVNCPKTDLAGQGYNEFTSQFGEKKLMVPRGTDLAPLKHVLSSDTQDLLNKAVELSKSPVTNSLQSAGRRASGGMSL